MKSEDRLIQIIEQNIDNGRETAFESLIQLHQTFLKKYIAVRVADSRDAEEIFWDSFQKIIQLVDFREKTIWNNREIHAKKNCQGWYF